MNHSYPYVRLQSEATHDATVGFDLRQVLQIPAEVSQEIGSEASTRPVLKTRNFGSVIGGSYYAPCMVESEPATYDTLIARYYTPSATTAASTGRRASSNVQGMAPRHQTESYVSHHATRTVRESSRHHSKPSRRRNVLTKSYPTRLLLRQKRSCIFSSKKSKRQIISRPRSPRIPLNYLDPLRNHPPSTVLGTDMALQRENAALKQEVAALRREQAFGAHYRWLYEVEQRKVEALRQQQEVQSQVGEQGSEDSQLVGDSVSADNDTQDQGSQSFADVSPSSIHHGDFHELPGPSSQTQRPQSPSPPPENSSTKGEPHEPSATSSDERLSPIEEEDDASELDVSIPTPNIPYKLPELNRLSTSFSSLFDVSDTEMEETHSEEQQFDKNATKSEVNDEVSPSSISEDFRRPEEARFRFGERRIEVVPRVQRVLISSSTTAEDLDLPASISEAIGNVVGWEWSTVPDVEVRDPRLGGE